jgi:hypothetical protein
MASSDYTITGSGLIAPYSELDGAIARLASTMTVGAIHTNETDPVVVGMAAMIGSEIVKVISVALPVVGIQRGCADTIPLPHADGTPVWFFDTEVGSDEIAYASGTTVGVKVLPFTNSGGAVPIANAPPFTVALNWRQSRPYPPGNLKCDGAVWFNERFVMADGDNDLIFTWAHRDRILQADQLIDHTAASIGPEPGTTYTARVYDNSDTLLRTVSGIVADTWTYTRAMATVDFPNVGTVQGHIEIESTRDGLESMNNYTTLIQIDGLWVDGTISASWSVAQIIENDIAVSWEIE